ncbi:MAG: hypothetical protein JHC93_08620, partial [Parachlamydiales bacterium]|nr:hypothetical protein [Parachlamydiales bacterium]
MYSVSGNYYAALEENVSRKPTKVVKQTIVRNENVPRKYQKKFYFKKSRSEESKLNEFMLTMFASDNSISPVARDYNLRFIQTDRIRAFHVKEMTFENIKNLALFFKKMHKIEPPKDFQLNDKSMTLIDFKSVYENIGYKP